MRWDQWWWQPWAWLWSDLERDRLGGRIIIWIAITWLIPWGVIGSWIGQSVSIGIVTMLGSAVGVVVIIVGGHALRIRQAQHRGWQTVFWEPTSWAVRRLTEETVWHDPSHWAAVPHWERHTIERRWPSASAFVQARRQEWQALVLLSQPEPDVVPAGVLISHTFSTIGRVPTAWRHQGTPLSTLPRRERRTLSRTQRHMFGQTIARTGPDVSDPQSWQVVALPLIGNLTMTTLQTYTAFNEPGAER